MTGPDAHAYGIEFEVLAPIATSTTAHVDLCRGTGPHAGQLLAVKRLLPEHLHDTTVSKRFLDEVWMTAALRHPHVVAVAGWGSDAQGPYLAVELVQGVSLARLAKTVFETGEQFTERLVVTIGLAIARGLGAAHDLVSERGEHLGLVHRDLSAHNVLVSFGGDVKVADFGLAKAKDRLTVTTSELPTRGLSHMAPEEVMQKAVDARADLFSLGVILFELLAGALPFQAKDDLATLRAIAHDPAPDLMALRPKLDRSIAALVARCLEKDPTARYQSAHEIAGELDQWLFNHGYHQENAESLGRFVRRNSMRQMRWFERVIAGEPEPLPAPVPHHPAPRIAHADASGSDGKSGAPTVRRDAETTVVEAKPRPALPPRRSRSSDAVPAAGRRRREEPEGGHDIQDFPTSGDEDVPTIAIRVTPEVRAQALAQATAAAQARSAAAAAAAADEAPTGRASETTESTATPVAPKPRAIPAPPPIPPRVPRGPLGTEVDPAGLIRRGPPPLPPKPAAPPVDAVRRRLEVALEQLTARAAPLREAAQSARLAATAAIAEAERAEASARAVDDQVQLARQALDVARAVSPAEALRHLETALAALGSPKA